LKANYRRRSLLHFYRLNNVFRAYFSYHSGDINALEMRMRNTSSTHWFFLSYN